VDILLLAVTIGLFLALVYLCVLPVAADTGDDLGDGQGQVVIPRPVKTSSSRPRTWAFLGVTAFLGLLFLGWQRPSPPGLYADLIRAVATAITRDPVSVNGYVTRLRPATQFLGVAYISGITVALRASLARRLAVLAHAVLYAAMSTLLNVIMVVGALSTGWAVAPLGIEATVANLLVGGLVVMRITFTTFILPRATTVRKRRRGRAWDSALAGCAVLTVSCVLLILYGFIALPANSTSIWQVFVPLYALSILFALACAPLSLSWWTGRRLPVPGEFRPPVDVIIPAYNEGSNISRLLASVDIAAGRYGGPVRVLVSDDGSTDDTATIADMEMAHFRHAFGEVVSGPNGRQAVALNRALAVSSAPVVVRIDADCVMGPDALRYCVPWFADPDIGSVGAMEEPWAEHWTWFHRLRVLETLFQFRFARLGQSVVDGIVVVPGTFTAFRRAPAMAIGGFPQGMNGEDSDLTMHIGRLGYRVAIDPRVRSFEDVPRSAGDFVEQRTRWARAGIHTFARHVPFRSGSAGPRVWLWTMRRGFSWFSLQAGMVAPIFMAELVMTHPSYRQNVATFAFLYALAGTLPLAVSLPYAIKSRQWRSIAWSPTWFAYAFLRRLATLEATISLPTRPVALPALRRGTYRHRQAAAAPEQATAIS